MGRRLGNAALGNALNAATAATNLLLDKIEAARDTGEVDEAERLGALLPKAAEAEAAARDKLENELLNPTGEQVRKLSAATRKLNDRLDKLRRDEAALSAVADALSALTSILLIFGL